MVQGAQSHHGDADRRNRELLRKFAIESKHHSAVRPRRGIVGSTPLAIPLRPSTVAVGAILHIAGGDRMGGCVGAHRLGEFRPAQNKSTHQAAPGCSQLGSTERAETAATLVGGMM